MSRIALGVEYDGSGFCGWQSQAGGGSVQDALESALAVIAGHPVRVHCAGRTDAAVHAIEQVVHFDTETSRPDSAWVRGGNAHLPDSVAIRWAVTVTDDFHARFSARARAYRYCLLNRAQRPGLANGRVGWYHRALDVAAMQEALRMLVGTHDFSSFRAAQCQARSPVRKLARASLTHDGDQLLFDFVADGFLHHMIRNIVGAMVYVGNGTLAPESIRTLLMQRDRREAPPTFSPHGLYFVGVRYDAAYHLPQISVPDDCAEQGRPTQPDSPQVSAGETAISPITKA
jgi:tRNA pseudouridine38-40 synthase